MLDYKKAGNYKPNTLPFDRMVSKVPSEAYKENWDRIFNKDKPEVPLFCRHCRELMPKCTCGNYEPDHNTK